MKTGNITGMRKMLNSLESEEAYKEQSVWNATETCTKTKNADRQAKTRGTPAVEENLINV